MARCNGFPPVYDLSDPVLPGSSCGDREEAISSGAGLDKLSLGDLPLMRMASGLPAICPRSRGDFTHGAVGQNRVV